MPEGGSKTTVENAVQTIEKRYQQEENDEFLKPIVFGEEARIRGFTLNFKIKK